MNSEKDFDVALLKKFFCAFRYCDRDGEPSFEELININRYKGGDFLELYRNLGWLSSHCSPLQLPLLDKLMIEEDVLFEMIEHWIDHDSRSAEVAHAIIFNECPYLERLVDSHSFRRMTTIRNVIKFVADVDQNADVLINLTVPCCKHDDSEDYRSVDGTPAKVVKWLVRRYDLDTPCRIRDVMINADDFDGRYPFHYYLPLD